MSESYGFQAEIEKPLPDGGRVDVSLKSDELMLACEVSVTTVALRDHKRPEMSRGGLRLCLCSCFQSEETCPLEIKTLFGSIAGATQPGQSVRFERAAA